MELVHIAGKEQLLYKSFPIDVCLIRGTTADEKGNISMEKEPFLLESRAAAMAAKNSGGRVIVQVERVVKAGTLHPRSVVIPHIYVDSVVRVPPDENLNGNDPLRQAAFSGTCRIPMADMPPLPWTPERLLPDGPRWSCNPVLL